MINRNLAIAIAAFHAAYASIDIAPTLPELDLAEKTAASAVDLVSRIPSFHSGEAAAKLSLAASLASDWPSASAKLEECARGELETIRINERLRGEAA